MPGFLGQDRKDEDLEEIQERKGWKKIGPELEQNNKKNYVKPEGKEEIKEEEKRGRKSIAEKPKNDSKKASSKDPNYQVI